MRNHKTIVITGGAGFIGSHLIEHVLKNTNWNIVSIDRLDTSGNPNRLSDMAIWEEEKKRVKIVYWDLKAEFNELKAKEIGDFDYFVHMAAGSHVDRSIIDPISFVMDNSVGTANCLEFFRKYCNDLQDDTWGQSDLPKFLYFSTDEVFGPAPEGVLYKEFDRHNPNNPYAAAKSAGEMYCDAWANTYKLPIIVTHCMNVFGERQHPEKFVPMLINKVMKGERVTIHSNKAKTKAGTRFYLHTRNICSAVIFVLENGNILDGKGTAGKYNVVGEKETDNLQMAQLVSQYVNEWRSLNKLRPIKLKYKMVDFHSSRPGHDLRYGLDGSLLKQEGFEYPVTFEDSLRRTVHWMLDHKEWL